MPRGTVAPRLASSWAHLCGLANSVWWPKPKNRGAAPIHGNCRRRWPNPASRSHEVVRKSVGELKDGGEKVLTGEGLSTEAGFGWRGTTTVARCGGWGGWLRIWIASRGRRGTQGGGSRVGEGPEVAVHGEVPVEEAANEKLAVAARTIRHWRWKMGREGGQSSGGASWRRGRACGKCAAGTRASRGEWVRGSECSNELRLSRGEDKATASVAHMDGRWQWSADSVGVSWRAVAEPPWFCHMRVGVRWPGHAAMGRRGLLASGPCHLNCSLNFKIYTKFVIQICGLPDV
jgi:hypothetical protein